MSFHQARDAFDNALRTLQSDSGISESPYAQTLRQLACAMLELTTAMEAGFHEAREDLTTVEKNLKEHLRSKG